MGFRRNGGIKQMEKSRCAMARRLFRFKGNNKKAPAKAGESG